MGDEGRGWRTQQGLVWGGIWGCEDGGGGKGESHLPRLEDWEDGDALNWEKVGVCCIPL